jgi:hypothetical protein
MKLKSLLPKLLTERFLSLLSVEDRRKYIDEVWDMLQKSYAKVGGFKSAPNKEELLKETDFWKLVKKNGKIVAIALYKFKRGRKSIAGGTDGTDLGKEWLMKIFLEDLQQNRSWSEVSDKVELIKTKMGYFKIPNKFVEEILNKPIISLDPDGYHYTRMIAGEPHTKMMVGHIDGFQVPEEFTND